MVLISRHGEGTIGCPTSLSSTLAACSRPSRPRKSCCTAVPASITMCTVPMLLEYMKISGTDSHRFWGWKSRMVKRDTRRSEEHTSELQSLMRISYAVFCLKKKKHHI